MLGHPKRENKVSDMLEAILDFTEKGKMVKGNFIQDEINKGGGGARDGSSQDKTLYAEFITELTHKRTKGIILRWHFFPQNDIFFFI